MRSVIKQANEAGIQAIVDQQFDIGKRIAAAGLVPIIEPEVDIHCPEKAEAENYLKAGLMIALDSLDADQLVMVETNPPGARQPLRRLRPPPERIEGGRTVRRLQS